MPVPAEPFWFEKYPTIPGKGYSDAACDYDPVTVYDGAQIMGEVNNDE